MKFINLLLLFVSLKGAVIELKQDNFKEFLDTHDLVLVTFYSKSCPHCTSFEPIFNEAAAESELLQRSYSFGRVEVNEEAIISDQNEIREYPTIRLFAMGTRVKPDYERDSQPILQFLDNYAHGLYKSLELFDHKEILSKRNTPTIEVIFKGEEGKELEEYKQAAFEFHDTKFFHISPKLGTELFPHIKKDTAIIIFKGFDEREVVYEDEIKAKKIKEFVEDNRFPRVKQFDHSTVGQIFKSNGMKALVLFYKSKEELKNLLSVFSEVASERKSKDMYFITADPSIDLGERVATNIGIQTEDTPVMIIIERKKDMEVYPFKGNFIKSEIVAFIDEWREGKVKKMPKSEKILKDNKGPVKQVVGKTFEEEVIKSKDKVLVNVCIPSRKECRDFEEIYNNVATQTNIKVVTINPAKNDIQGIELTKEYPTLLLFSNNEYTVYTGELTETSILNFINTDNLNSAQKIEL
jgi:protein disulfide isomerase